MEGFYLIQCSKEQLEVLIKQLRLRVHELRNRLQVVTNRLALETNEADRLKLISEEITLRTNLSNSEESRTAFESCIWTPQRYAVPPDAETSETKGAG